MLFKVNALTKILCFAGLAFSVVSFAHEQEDFFMPENDLHLRNGFLSGDVTEEDFNRILDEFELVYTPLFANTFGKELVINRLWVNTTVNASASQLGDRWLIKMYGGLARARPTTPDGFALVVCHELGHHLGGVPFYAGRWAASEGQSDYFGAIACARKMWQGQLDINATYRNIVDSEEDLHIAKEKCDDVYTSVEDQNLCYRIAMAGHSLARLLGSLRNLTPKFSQPSPTVVTRTYTRHPEAQCRLDTYLAGALCKIDWDDEQIPGKTQKDRNSLLAHIKAAPYACHNYGSSFAARPRCWFNPKDYKAEPISIEKLTKISTLDQDEVLNIAPLSFAAGSQIFVDMVGDGDADLFTKWDQIPTQESNDCGPFLFGSNESCQFKPIAEDRLLFTVVKGWSSLSNIEINIGIKSQPKLCHNHGGGQGLAFPCWKKFSCKLINDTDTDTPINWCIQDEDENK